MMPVSIAGRTGKDQDHHIRAESPDVIDHISQDLIAIPFLECLVGGFREPEIDGTGEILLGSVDAPGREQFLAADDSQFVALLRSDQVLPTLASGERKVSGPHMPAKSEVCKHLFALVVGVRADHHDAAQGVEAFQRLADFDFAADGPLGGRGNQPDDQKQG